MRCVSYCTVFPDDALRSGPGSCAIRHSHSVHAGVLCAVSINLKRCRLLLGVHTDVWPRTSALEVSARARGQCHSHRSNSSFRLPFPGYHGDLFQVFPPDLGFQNQAGTGDYVHRLFVDYVQWQTVEPTWHWGQRLNRLLFNVVWMYTMWSKVYGHHATSVALGFSGKGGTLTAVLNFHSV